MRNKGITLIALIITIIILIILAGVTFGILLGEEGLINRSRLGAFNYKLAAIEENILTNKDFDTNANITLDFSKVFDGQYDETGITASLKRDIVKEREGIQKDSDITIEQINTKYASYVSDGKIAEIYYVKTEYTGDSTPHKYVYDTKTGIALQVPAEIIAGYEYHIKTVENTRTGGVAPGSGNNANIPNNNIPTSPNIGKDVTEDITPSSYNQDNPSNKAKLDLGEAINLRLKKIAALANGVSETVTDNWTVYNTSSGFTGGTPTLDTYITAIKWSETEPTAEQKATKYGNLAMTTASVLGESDDPTCYSTRRILSDIPIYAWYNTSDNSIYVWSSNSELQLHPHSERMFEGMSALTDVSGFADHWKISDTDSEKLGTVRYMFKDTKVTNYNSIGWNVSEWTNTMSYLEEPGNNIFYKMCKGTPTGTDGKPSHPVFENSPGIWDNEGTFFPDIVYPEYTMGQEIVLLGEKYYVVENSDSSTSTVKLLTEKPVRTSDYRQYYKPDFPRYDDDSCDYATSEIAQKVAEYQGILERRMNKGLTEVRLMKHNEAEGLRTNGYTDILYGSTNKWDYWIIESTTGNSQTAIWRK